MRSAEEHVRAVVEHFDDTGLIEPLLASTLPSPAVLGSDGLVDLATARWHRYRAVSGFGGLREREAAVAVAARLRRHDRARLPAGLRAAAPDPAVARVADTAQCRALARAVAARRPDDRDSLVALANAYATVIDVVDDDRMRAALMADHAPVLLAIDDHDGVGRHARIAVDALTWAVDHTPEDDPQRARRLLELARAYARTDEPVSRVLMRHKAAARVALLQHPVAWDVVAELAQAQTDAYARTAELRLLVELFATCRDLSDALGRDFPGVSFASTMAQVSAETTRELGAAQVEWLLRTHHDPGALAEQHDYIDELREQALTDSSPDVVDRRVDAARWLVSALPLHHGDRLVALLLLYGAHVDAWELAGDADAVADALDVADEALHTTSATHAHRDRALKAVAHAATTLAEHTGSADVADRAVDAARAGLDLVARHDADARAELLSVLGRALRAAFRIGGDPDVGRESLDRARRSVALTRPDDENYALRCTTLCTSARELGEATRDPDVLSEAVEAGGLAVAALPAGDVRRVGILYNYASAVLALACLSTAPEPFAEAEQALRDALALLPPGHPDHPRIDSTIADVLYQRHRVCGDLDAVAASVPLAERAVRATPQEHHWWPRRALALARSAGALAEFGGPGAAALRATAVAHYRAIGTHPAAPAEFRALAERAQAELLAAEDPGTVLDAHERVIAAVPGTVSRALPTSRRLDAARRLDGLADAVVAAGVRAGELDRALALVERSRGVVFGDAWGVRRGWARLRSARPDLAERLSAVERELDEADAGTGVRFHITVTAGDRSVDRDWDPRPGAITRVRRLAARRDDLVAEIQDVPGFEDLLTPPDPATLRARLAGHTVVLVSAHTDGGAAVVVPADPARLPHAVPLPRLTRSAAGDQARRLRAALATARDRTASFDRREDAQHQVHDVLEWLWDTTAEPVLDRVAPRPGWVEPPRLWWCPIGVVTRLPVHAAGRHRAPDRSARTVLDRVVASYTPSLTALADTLGARPSPPPRGSALVVGVGTVRGELVLPNAHAEAAAVARLVPGSTVLLDAAADVDAIERGLHEHAVAHFACHASAPGSLSHADHGGLVLGEGTFAPAFVRDLRVTHSELAFLSACDTAGADTDDLDEPLNLAAAFHLAGFRSVIGTMWHTADNPDTAEAVYAALTGGGAWPVDTTAAATALANAVRRVRDTYPAVPTRWASHVHIGL